MAQRGDRGRITRDQVLGTAVGLADAGGLGGLSMRRLGAELGVEAMSLYHHVANKTALLDGMVDAVFAEVALPAGAGEWRAELRERCASLRAALIRHPWATALLETRTSPGPATLRQHDAVLGALRGAGFSPALTGHAFAALDAYVVGFAVQEQNLPFAGQPDAAPVLESVTAAMGSGEYPHLVEFAAAQVLQPGYAFADEFDWGLDLLLDGLARALDEERRPPR